MRIRSFLLAAISALILALSSWAMASDEGSRKASSLWLSSPEYRLPGLSLPSSLFRDPPSLTRQYSLGGKDWMPFFGLGFQGGETTDLSRQLFRESLSDGRAASSGLNRTLMPNEFQGGLRIPF
jgi:hypothetical protein